MCAEAVLQFERRSSRVKTKRENRDIIRIDLEVSMYNDDRQR